jgi:hypothetical protein
LARFDDTSSLVDKAYSSENYNYLFILSPSGPRFRKHRRFINQTFNERASAAFRPLREKETLMLLDDMTRSPNQYSQHFRRFGPINSCMWRSHKIFPRFAAAMIFGVTYGYQITSAQDEYVLLGSVLIETPPILC